MQESVLQKAAPGQIRMVVAACLYSQSCKVSSLHVGALLLILSTAYAPYADLVDFFFDNGITGIYRWYWIGVLIIWLLLYKIGEGKE